VNILFRYIFKELLGPFFLGLFVFTFVMQINVIIKLMDLFITKGVSLQTTVQLLGLSLPYILVMTIPMSVLLAVLLTFSRFSSDSEITAMRASGISLHMMMPPVILFAIFSYMLSSAIYINVLPRSNLMVKQLRYDILRTKANIGIKPHVFNTDFINLVIYVNRILHDTNELEGIFIADNRDPEQPLVIVSKSGQEILDPENETIVMRLNQGCTHEIFKGDKHRYSLTPFSTMDLNLDMKLFKKSSVSKSDREMTISELYRKAKRNDKLGRGSGRQWVEIWKKSSMPFACIVFAVLGIPLGVTSRRGGKSAAFATSIGLILVYYIFLTGGTGLAEEGKFPPFLAAWLPNILLGGLALFLYLRMARDATFQVLEGFTDFIIQSGRKILIKASFGTSRSDLRKSMSSRPIYLGRILDRYTAAMFIKFFFYIFLCLLAISLIVHIFEKIDNLVENSANLYDSFIALFLKLPYFGYLAIPFATLVTTILAIGAFNRTSELIAMKASGISYLRINFPIIVLGCLITLLTFFTNESIVPYCNQQVERAWDRIKKRERTQFVRYHRWYRGKQGDIYYFQHYDTDRKIITGFSQFTISDDMKITDHLEASEMIWKNRKWVCSDGRKIKIDSIEGTILSDENFSVFVNSIPESPEDFSKEHKESEEMNIHELSEYISILKSIGFDTTEYEVDWHAKLSIPFLSTIMVLIGIAFATQKPRSSGGMIGIGAATFLGAIYFLVFRTCLEFGHAGMMPPFLSAWTCNIGFLIASAWFVYRATQRLS